jgi:CheY-like chemotaxis protein
MSTPAFVYFEDDASSRHLMGILMEQVLGYQHFAMFEDSADPLGKVASLSFIPNVFFLDIHIAPHNGYDLFHLFRQEAAFADAIFIAMTASVMRDEIEALREVGFHSLLSKPLRKKQFPELLARILEGEPIWAIS